MCLRGQVIFDPLTSGLEAESGFRPEAKQIIAGRYVVIQYLGAGMFCHTVQCEDLQGEGAHRFVCVKISKNSKNVFDQNLWEVNHDTRACKHTDKQTLSHARSHARSHTRTHARRSVPPSPRRTTY